MHSILKKKTLRDKRQSNKALQRRPCCAVLMHPAMPLTAPLNAGVRCFVATGFALDSKEQSRQNQEVIDRGRSTLMERIVYLLGAGFSAPLGLPVMSNFFTNSKDMYFKNPSNYPHFQGVFDTIQEMSVIKNYYSTDLFNIEEILSILEMGEYLQGNQLKGDFLKYIVDVINYYTPKLQPHPPGGLPGNWYDFL